MLMRRKKIINKAENKSKLTTDVSENGKSYKSQCNVILGNIMFCLFQYFQNFLFNYLQLSPASNTIAYSV